MKERCRHLAELKRNGGFAGLNSHVLSEKMGIGCASVLITHCKQQNVTRPTSQPQQKRE
eukprot:m.89899 g.89899  ORF g.89899 m.89899 type:complete len:59 (-) comp14869_c0_seq1:1859-2035(-)